MKKSVLLALLIAHSAHAIPYNWQGKREESFVSYHPRDIGERTFFIIALDPLPLHGQSQDAWANTLAQTLTQNYGRLVRDDGAQYDAPLWHTTHHLQSQNGQSLIATYQALAQESGMARMVIMLSENDPALLAAYNDQAAKFLAELLTKAPDTRSRLALPGLAQRGHPKPQFGAPFVYGHYRCDMENGRHPYSIEFDLYDTGEYRSSARSYKSGDYSIDPGFYTVNLETQFNLFNDDSGDEARHIAVYFRDADGKAWLYGENLDDGEATLCRHTGAAAKPSPSEEKAAAAEAQRFKWTTAPDQGVAMADIEAILHHAEHKNDSLGIRLEEAHILLLKDGWAYTALRVSPADLDVAASRKHEPERWQRWRQTNGNYQLHINGNWQDADGQATRPAARGETLNGAYSHAVMHGNIYTTAHTFKDTLYFYADGTLQSSSSMRGGTTALNTGTFSANVASDQQDDTPVRYQLDGYTLIRTYPDGSTTRSLAYFWGDGQKHLAINGVTYSSD